MEQTLAELIASIPHGPRSAFQMYAQEKLDRLELHGPLPDNMAASVMQKQFVSEFNTLASEQQTAYHQRGVSKFQEQMQAAHARIRQVRCLPC